MAPPETPKPSEVRELLPGAVLVGLPHAQRVALLVRWQQDGLV